MGAAALREHCAVYGDLRRERSAVSSWSVCPFGVIALLSLRSAGFQQQVRGAGLEAGEIHRHVDVAELAEPRDDPGVAVILPETGELLVGELETCEAIVMPDAMPALDSSASESTVAVRGATVADRPRENTSRAGSRPVR